MLAMTSCSTKKNTGTTRAWHSFTAKYNTYYNGTLAYIDGSLEKEKGNKDNFTERLPLYTVSNKSSRELGKGNFETAITKCQKTIQLHSIKTKPEWNKDRRKTDKDIEWLSRKEYNPFLWKAWLLMGRSQFFKGDFDEAAATFSYMSRLYKGQPAIYGRARAWLAKCYVESDWIYDAEDVMRNMERDSIHWRAQKEWDYTYCDYYLKTNNLPKASEYLRKVIKHEMRSKQKAREYYLLGQIEAAQGNREEAYKAFRKVIRQNPQYELEFNARIAMTEVMAKGHAKQMISRLKRMARNDNNKEYLDQVYYAMGNIYLSEKDTMRAIGAYEKGNEKATRSGIEKGVLLLHLGDLYWMLEKYGDAKRCYGEAIGLLDKDRKDYQQLADRSKVLDELVPYTDAIYLQDSLQVLAKMDEMERNEAIDRVIDALKKKEKEEEAKAAEKEVADRQQKYGNTDSKIKNNAPVNKAPVMNNRNAGQWYFYNPQAVQQGKQIFQRTWGKRENTDDWRRNNKTVVGGDFAMEDLSVDSLMANMTQEQKDSLVAEQEKKGNEEEKNDSAVNDPHKREYYLAQIPFTEEQMQASHEIIKDGLYHSAVIFKDKLDNLPLSEKQFKRLQTQYPEYAPKDEMYYHLFLLYSRMNKGETAQAYVDSLKASYPESKWTIVLTDPYFEENAKFGKHIEDSIYGATYLAFKEDRFQEVYGNAEVSAKRFPLGDNRDRFLFIEGLTRLNDGDIKMCMARMDSVVTGYPKSPVAEMAGMIINGVKAGKQLHGAKFDLSDVWNRRNITLNDESVDTTKTFSADRNTEFQFIFAYQPDSLDENRLLFQLARYNFTNFLVRNFDLTIENVYGMRHMTVSGFRNFDEVRQYASMVEKQEGIRQVASRAKTVLISPENLALIGGRYSYNDYDTFYVANFAPLTVMNPDMLYEPVRSNMTEVKETKRDEEHGEVRDDADARKPVDDDPVDVLLPTEEVAPGGVKPVEPQKKLSPEEEEQQKHEEGFAISESDTEVITPQEEFDVPEDSQQTVPQEEFVVPAEEKVQPAQQEEFAVPVEEENQQVLQDEFVIPQEEEKPVQQEEFVIPQEEEKVQESTEEVIFEDSSAVDTKVAEDDNIILDDAESEKESTDALEDEYYELDGF